MKSIGPLYVDSIKLKHPIMPLFEWGWSQETEYPFRESKVCAVFWLPLVPRGYAIGIWGKPVREDEAMKRVTRFGRRDPNEMSVEQIRAFTQIDREEGW